MGRFSRSIFVTVGVRVVGMTIAFPKNEDFFFAIYFAKEKRKTGRSEMNHTPLAARV